MTTENQECYCEMASCDCTLRNFEHRIYEMMYTMKSSVLRLFVCGLLGVINLGYSQGFIAETGGKGINNDRTIQIFEKSLSDAGVPIGVGAEELASIVKWSSMNNRSAQCISWLEQKIAISPNSLYLVMALADSLYLDENWRILHETIIKQNWLYQEHIRYGYLSIALRELNDEKTWQEFWNKAVGEVSLSKEKFRSLISLVSTRKNWGDEIEEVLWQQIEEDLPARGWSLDVLHKVYQKQESLVGLKKINDFLMILNPKNFDLMNNYIVYQILSDDIEGIDSDVINAFVGGMNLKNEYVLTYSFYLAASGNYEPLKGLMSSLTEEFLSSPQNALYAAAVFQQCDSPFEVDLISQARKGDYTSFETQYFNRLGLIPDDFKSSSSSKK